MVDKLEKLTPREKKLLLAAAACVFALILNRLVFDAVFQAFRAVQREADSAEQRLRSFEAVLGSRAAVEAEYGRAFALLGSVGTSSEEIDRVNSAIDRLAKKTGIICQATETRELPASGPCVEYVTEIPKFRATMKSLLAFLHELQAAPGLVRVTKLAVLAARDQPGWTEGSMVITKLAIKPTQ